MVDGSLAIDGIFGNIILTAGNIEAFAMIFGRQGTKQASSSHICILYNKNMYTYYMDDETKYLTLCAQGV